MRILCRHGHFAFYPKHAGDIARFTQYYGVTLVRVRDFYTFPLLEEAPTFSIEGLSYLGLPATVTFQGEPWEVMKENGLVYNIDKESLVHKEIILNQIAPPLAGFYFVSSAPLIQPGSRNAVGRQVLSYDGEYILDTLQLRLSEFSYE